MGFKIISDSSSDVLQLQDTNYATVPLKMITADKEYIDDSSLNVGEMLSDLEKYKGRSSSSCPNADDWQQAFEEAKDIFCVTITSGLSGSYNTATVAATDYMENHPDRHVHVIDTLSTGPENALILEKLRELILNGLNFENIVKQIKEYQKHTHLIFALESLHNLANNGRVSNMVAKIAGIFDIRIVGRASLQGVLEVTNKTRGAKKTISQIFANMKAHGYRGGKVRIHHCQNAEGAESLKNEITKQFPKTKIEIAPTGGLCSYYAERGGLLVGFEGNDKCKGAVAAV